MPATLDYDSSDTKSLTPLAVLPPPNRLKWVLFDLDMTLWNHELALQHALEDLCGKMGIPYALFRRHYSEQSRLQWEAFKRREIDIPTLRHRRLFNAFELSGSRRSDREIRDLCEYYLSIYHSYQGEMEGAFEVMRLASMFSKLGILTNASRELQTRKIQQLKGSDLLTLVLTVDETGCPKTDPNFYREAERLMNYPMPERVLYIGDSWEDDVVPSFAKGWNTVWITAENAPRPDRSIRVPKITSVVDLVPYFNQTRDQYQ
ncbi:MAG: HAD family hydrolase [Candidatus Sumerlaeia bacterium]|nr:HAD family hydrolase [Candidatus Sumerlaeia bacterium]